MWKRNLLLSLSLLSSLPACGEESRRSEATATSPSEARDPEGLPDEQPAAPAAASFRGDVSAEAVVDEPASAPPDGPAADALDAGTSSASDPFAAEAGTNGELDATLDLDAGLAACLATEAATECPPSSTDGATDSGDSAPPAQDAGNVAADARVAPRDAAVECWQLPVVDRARLYPAPGKAALLLQGKIEGSHVSAMNDFSELSRIVTPASERQWVELRFPNSVAYRYVKYHAPLGSYGALAELELYAGDVRVTGAGFGSSGSRGDAGTTYPRALDGDTQTVFEAPLPDDDYVGLDLAAGHVLSAPTLTQNGSGASARVTISAEPGARILFTTDGRDPRSAGTPYTTAIALGSQSTLVRAVAMRACMQTSEISQQLYRAANSQQNAQSSMHVGNSLTDTIVEYLQPLSQSGGITLDFNRYTVPGAGTYLYELYPSGGYGVANVQQTLRTRAFDHLSLQAFPNMPCQIKPSADGNDSDSGYMNQMWSDARAQNPNVQLWVYQQWPAPIEFSNCLSGGGWTRGDWKPPAPKNWEEAVANELAYQEALRTELIRLNPSARIPYIVPAGNALVLLKRNIEAGAVPGLSNFFGEIFAANGTDLHMSRKGAYFVTLVFYACMYQSRATGTLPELAIGLSAEQAAAFQRIAWEAASAYPLSGITR